jgi:hypothetical protein
VLDEPDGGGADGAARGSAGGGRDSRGGVDGVYDEGAHEFDVDVDELEAAPLRHSDASAHSPLEPSPDAGSGVDVGGRRGSTVGGARSGGARGDVDGHELEVAPARRPHGRRVSFTPAYSAETIQLHERLATLLPTDTSACDFATDCVRVEKTPCAHAALDAAYSVPRRAALAALPWPCAALAPRCYATLPRHATLPALLLTLLPFGY